MSRSNRIAQQLGMPHGTANNRLRKFILFDLLKRHNENLCFKCGKEIQTVDTLSIEHKKPWEGISAELFWDLDNIAFSHIGCNRPDRPYIPPTIQTKEGFAWCSRCKKEKAINEFHSNKDHHNGLNRECKTCKSELNANRIR